MSEERASTGLNGLLERLPPSLRANVPLLLLVGGAALVALITALVLWTRAPDYRVLFSNLSEADGGRIISELDTRGVPYQFSQGGQALLVPANQVHPLRLQLAEQGLPRGGNVGFELMDTQAFGISQFAEQVNFQRSLEGELSRSIESMGAVEKARVHLAMARPSVFVREREPAKASVVLTLFGGRSLSEEQVSAIRHLVASSVPELTAAEVTIVDQRGQMLSRDPNPNDLNAQQLLYRDEVERSYQQRIENILAPIFGRDRVRAQVSAQIDFSHREETMERFGPNQPPNDSAIRSRQSNVSFSGDEDKLVGGIPGALSNTPPGVAASPIELAPPDDQDDGDAQADQDGPPPEPMETSLQREDVINYEVDRSVAHLRKERGLVERLSAAVVVDYRIQRNDAGELETVALTPEELTQVEGLARRAMGFSAERGDTIEVVNSAFSRHDEVAMEWWQDPEVMQLVVVFGEPLLWLFLLLLAYLLLLRPFIKHYTRPPELEAATSEGVNIQVGDGEEGEGEDEDEAGVDGDSTAYKKSARRNKALGYQEKLADLRNTAQTDPHIVALIVRNWLKQ
ncbi:MAG: flagellar basal-body MS-ring/collar protein FliF [Lamprobacter sp.]|uniref:flagellar basal-body MS-ring/collar protein FliF n=1 Tax=Lamprobacter sp. TaxID=3100796 RepID=UPI002B257146|nr:flagellar basal-body MS-ring/collar protein FliF [Lamprobacter sp.]MEA3639207.1 flagellar basal-body MS-ring/collar protein FliF [Lamprobacter sp.]